MMSIELNGMIFHAPIGVYDYEQRDGNDIVVDIRLTISEPERFDDDLHGTINYAEVYKIVETEVSRPTQLLETVANSIRSAVVRQYHDIKSLTIRVSKLSPPVGGPVHDATVELTW